MHLFRLSITILLSSLSIYSFSQDTTSKSFVKVTGEVTKQLTLTMEDLVKMKPVTVTMKDRNGAGHAYKGVNIREILAMAGVTIGAQLRGGNLSKYLLVKCADGYEIVFSLAELDSSFNDRVVILSYESDGKALPSQMGPFRLIVPGEKKPARSAFQVVGLLVKFARE